jgi:hypothetical protein
MSWLDMELVQHHLRATERKGGALSIPIHVLLDSLEANRTPVTGFSITFWRIEEDGNETSEPARLAGKCKPHSTGK